MEELYLMHKPLLFSIAYQMLGTVMEAEDVVQDIFFDLQHIEMEKMVNPKAYLCRMVTNRSIDYLRSARKKREVYTGPWLPEPLVDSRGGEEPLEAVLQNDRISYALLRVMEQLSPVERAVFVLKEAFGFSYEEIASFVGKEEANCRKILSRARRKLKLREEEDGDVWSRSEEKASRHDELVQQFIFASSTGNLNGLLQLLNEDVVLYSDGGGKVSAALVPIESSTRVAQFILGLVRKFREEMRVTLVNVNGQTGIFLEKSGVLESVICFDMDESSRRIRNIYILRNPEKLGHIVPVD